MKLKNCHRCEGSKKCIGIGFMRVDCPNCKGTGKVEDETKVETFVAPAVGEVILTNPPIDVEASKQKTKNAFKKAAAAKLDT
jgi:hypothetical protein